METSSEDEGQESSYPSKRKSLSWLEFINYIMLLDWEHLELRKVIRETPFSDSWLKSLPTGAIIGSVVFTDSVLNHKSVWAEKTPMGKIGEYELPTCLEPPYKPVYNWLASGSILFDKPILNVKGKLSFWKYPNIGCEPDEDGTEICCCNLGIDEKDQVLSYGNGDYRCRYCGGRWYK